MSLYDEFLRLAEERFSFLEESYEFRLTERSAREPQAWVTYEKDFKSITVSLEFGRGTTVTLVESIPSPEAAVMARPEDIERSIRKRELDLASEAGDSASQLFELARTIREHFENFLRAGPLEPS